jgi:hypothetical protein
LEEKGKLGVLGGNFITPAGEAPEQKDAWERLPMPFYVLAILHVILHLIITKA